MATPVNDSYSTASGGTIYGGTDNLPDWLPANGSHGYISSPQGNGGYMSDVFDVNNPDPMLRDPDGTYILDVWNSTTLCSGWGTMGGIAAFGGGHNDRVNNSVFMYDIALQRWFRISDATPLGVHAWNSDNVYGNVPSGQIFNDWGEYWTDDTRTAVVTGKCGPPHTYDNIKYVPGSAAGNIQGYLVLFGNFSGGCHRIDLDNPSNGWDRIGGLFKDVVPTTKYPAYGVTIWDSIRNRLFCIPSNGGGQNNSLNLDFPSKTISTSTNFYIELYEHMGRHAVADDRYLMFRSQGPNTYPQVIVANPDTGTRVIATHSGELTPWLFTMEWDEQHRRLVGWDGITKKLWFGQAPLNINSGSWVWSSQEFESALPIVQQAGPNLMYSRLHFDANLQAYLVVTRVSGPVQCFKL